MTFHFDDGKVFLDLTTREAAMAAKEKLREMDEEGAFDHDRNMPDAALRYINRRYEPKPDWEGLGIDKN